MNVPTHLKLALTVDEAAAMLSVSNHTIRRMVQRGDLAKVPYTTRMIIARAELERFVNSGRAA